MMNVAAIVFICTAMNHMGLVRAVEERIGLDMPVIGCVKCSTFWATLIFLSVTTRVFITSMAVAFLCSYISIWLELGMGYIDKLYLKCYEKIVSTADTDKTAEDSDNGTSADSLP